MIEFKHETAMADNADLRDGVEQVLRTCRKIFRFGAIRLGCGAPLADVADQRVAVGIVDMGEFNTDTVW